MQDKNKLNLVKNIISGRAGNINPAHPGQWWIVYLYIHTYLQLAKPALTWTLAKQKGVLSSNSAHFL